MQNTVSWLAEMICVYIYYYIYLNKSQCTHHWQASQF